MADSTAQFANQAQDMTRSMVGAAQGLAETQMNILQRLGEVQQGMMRQSYEAANEQLQIISQIRDPREFASAQAKLVKSHGQKYVDTIKQTVDSLAQAWEDYGNRLESTVNTAVDKTRAAASSKKSS